VDSLSVTIIASSSWWSLVLKTFKKVSLLVGGFNHLESMGRIIPYIMEHETCLKAPISIIMIAITVAIFIVIMITTIIINSCVFLLLYTSINTINIVLQLHYIIFDSLILLCYHLVGGIPTPLKNMSSSVGIIIPNI